jgi:hypothetical protein
VGCLGFANISYIIELNKGYLCIFKVQLGGQQSRSA